MALSSEAVERVSISSEPGASSTAATASAASAAIAPSTGTGFQRSTPSTARPLSSAAKLDCDSDSTSPAHSTPSAQVTSTTVRRSRLQTRIAASAIIVSARKRP